MEAVMMSSCISEFTHVSLVRIFYFPTTLPRQRKLDQMAFKTSLHNATLGCNFVLLFFKRRNACLLIQSPVCDLMHSCSSCASSRHPSIAINGEGDGVRGSALLSHSLSLFANGHLPKIAGLVACLPKKK